MSSIYSFGDRNITFMKGAPEVVASMCSYVQMGDERQKMPDDFNVKLNETIQKFTSSGLVICV